MSAIRSDEVSLTPRAVCFLFDFVFFCVLSAPLMLSPWTGVFRSVQWPLLVGLAPVLPFLYFIVPTALWGRTPAKLLLHFKVTDTAGARPRVWRVILRETVKILSVASVVGVLVVVLENIVARAPFYDRACNTQVVRDSRVSMPLWTLVLIFAIPTLSLGTCLIPVWWLMQPTAARSLALETLRSDATISKRFGKPLGGGWVLRSRMRLEGQVSEADFSFPIAGPGMSGTAFVEATQVAGKWSIDYLRVDLAEVPEQIVVVEKQKPPPNVAPAN